MATGHSGITLAQVTGKIIREIVTTGHSSIPIDEYHLLRFSAGRYYFDMDAYRRARAQMAQAN
jgi:glycine/D-amino acid oxidase-like deaminating enzyme